MKIQQNRANRAHGWNRALVHCGVLLAVGVLAVPAWGYSSGVAGFAGAPGESTPIPPNPQTCAHCHSGGSYSGSFVLDVPNDPPIVVAEQLSIDLFWDRQIGSAVPVRWGFNLIAIDSATGLPTGTLGVGTGSRELASTVFGGIGWDYLSHNQSGTTNRIDPQDPTSSPGWQVFWEAPKEPVAEVTFYASFNAANGGGRGGDTIFTQQVVVSVPEPGALGAGVIALMALTAVCSRRH